MTVNTNYKVQVCTLFTVLFLLANFFLTYKGITSAFENYESIFLQLTVSTILYFIAIVTLIQYQFFKEDTYLYYVLYILINVLYLTTMVNTEVAVSNSLPSWFYKIRPFTSLPILIISYYFYTYFAINFLTLNTKDRLSYIWLKRFTKVYIVLFVIALATYFIAPTAPISLIIRSGLLIVCMPLGLCSIVIVYLRVNNKITRIFCLGSLLFTLGSILGFLYAGNSIPFIVNKFPFNKWIFYTECGTVLEMIMFGSSFAYRNKLLADEEKKAQLALLIELEENRAKEQKLQQIRNEIAINLHDEIGSTITSINILSNVSQQAIEKKPQQAKEMLKQIAVQSKQIQQTMSDIVWSIRPDNEKFENLIVRMKEYSAQTLEPLSIKNNFIFNNQLTEIVLPLHYRKDVLLIFKEAVNNISKHSKATAVIITITQLKNELLLSINDNGQWKENSITTGTGTKSMQLRAAAIGGTLSIEKANTGTTILLQVNLN